MTITSVEAALRAGMDAQSDRTLGPMVQLHRSLQQVQDSLRPMAQLQSSLHQIQDALFPPSMRLMLSMQRQLNDVVPVGTHALLADISRWNSELNDLGGLGASMRAITGVLREQQRLGEVATGGVMGAQLRGALGSRLAASATPYLRLRRSLDALLPPSLALQWQDHLAASMVPSFDILSMGWIRPVGLLAPMVEPQLGASLSWTRPSLERPSIAALITEGDRLPQITIGVVVTCAFCGDEMIRSESTFRWKGNRKGVIDVTVVPICSTCSSRANEDPDYIEDALFELTRPQLRVVSTGGATDGVPRGKLHLVRDDDLVDE